MAYIFPQNVKFTQLQKDKLRSISTDGETELLTPYTPTRSLRSSDKSLLVVPLTKSSSGDRAFSVVAPKL